MTLAWTGDHVTDRGKTTSAAALRQMQLSAPETKAAGHHILATFAAHTCAVLQHFLSVQ